jgi:hypothetical protein
MPPVVEESVPWLAGGIMAENEREVNLVRKINSRSNGPVNDEGFP